MVSAVAAQTGVASEDTATEASPDEMWAALEESVEPMCKCIGWRILEEMTFSKWARLSEEHQGEKVQTWMMEAFSGGRCRPTGVFARFMGLPEEPSDDKTSEQDPSQLDENPLSQLEFTAFSTGCVQSIVAPAKRDYAIRGQVGEAFTLVVAAKRAVTEYLVNNGELPRNRTAAGMSANAHDTQGTYVASVDVVRGVLIITYGNEADHRISGQTITLTPYETAGVGVRWRCESTIANKYLPQACFSPMPGTD